MKKFNWCEQKVDHGLSNELSTKVVRHPSGQHSLCGRHIHNRIRTMCNTKWKALEESKPLTSTIVQWFNLTLLPWPGTVSRVKLMQSVLSLTCKLSHMLYMTYVMVSYSTLTSLSHKLDQQVYSRINHGLLQRYVKWKISDLDLTHITPKSNPGFLVARKNFMKIHQ